MTIYKIIAGTVCDKNNCCNGASRIFIFYYLSHSFVVVMHRYVCVVSVGVDVRMCVTDYAHVHFCLHTGMYITPLK